MKTIIEKRASLIIYHFIESNKSFFINKKVLLPANVCPILPLTLLKAGVEFDFIDINPDTLCIDHQQLWNSLRRHPISAIFYVRTFGYIEDTTSLFSKIKNVNKDVIIIDDRCAGMPDLTVPDNNADMYLYSTGYAKFVEFGKGGFAFIRESFSYHTNVLPYYDVEHSALVEQMNNCVKTNIPFIYTYNNWLGSQKNMNTGSVYFEKIADEKSKVLEHKKLLNSIYASMLPESIQIPIHFQFWRFSILVENKKEILDCIFEHNLFASSHYSSISHLFGGEHSKNAENTHAHIINLFNDYRFTPEMARKCAQLVNSIINR